VWGMAVLLAGVSRSEKGGGAAESEGRLQWLALTGVLGAGLMNGWLYQVAVLGEPGVITVDRFRLFSNWILLLGAGMTILISTPYVSRQRLQVGEFYALILLATVGMMIMVGTRNLIVLFLALETMSIAAYALTAYNRRDPRSAEAGLKYFILGAFSSVFLLYGIALVWGATGSVVLPQIAATIEEGAGFTGLLLAGMGLLCIGFAFKVSAVPFHMWVPDVYEGAPSPATAFMAAAVKTASLLAFVRVFLEAFWNLYATWYVIIWWLAALTIIVANVIALTQSSVKRMLAYSSVAHGGYLLVGLAAAREGATASILFYLLVYTVMTVGAFGMLIVVSSHSEDRLEVEDYAGFGWAEPRFGVLFTIFLLSLAGFPGTGGFMAKIFLLQGAAESQLWTLAVLLALGTVVSYYYYLRVAWYMWMKPTPEGKVGSVAPVPIPMQVALFGAAVAILCLGVFPGGLMDGARSAAQGLGLFTMEGFLGLAP
jgi:NADH-quinone oxidoreductase subunit N